MQNRELNEEVGKKARGQEVTVDLNDQKTAEDP
jgi:hypothetical protein